MISLKAAIVTASAAGAVAAGGIAWGSIAQPEAAPVAANGALPVAVDKAAKAVPTPSPTCVPASEPARKGGQVPAPGAGSLPKVPDARGELPDVKGQLPAKPDVKAPGAPEARVPAGADLKNPGLKNPDLKLPVCPEKGGDPAAARKPAAGLPKLPKPDRPGIPAVAVPDCDNLAPAVEVGGRLERALMLPMGLKHASTAKTLKTVKGARPERVCAVTQKWVSRAGTAGWVTVERIQAPKGTGHERLREALKLPQGGRTTPVGGAVMWQAPAGQSGVLVVAPDGGALYVNGSPVHSGGLKDVAAKLAQAAK